MRIVIANKYYYIDGGPERYLFSLSDYLRSLGHEVIPFAVAYPRNEPSEYAKYFVNPAGGGGETKLDKLEGGLGTKFRIAGRTVYSVEAKRALERLIDDTKPDLIYCLNIVNHLSPSIIDAAHEKRVPVVLRLSDYYLMCASYLFRRASGVCTDCENGFYRALFHNCVHGSRPATVVRVAGMYAHNFWRVYEKPGAIVTTTKFMSDALVRFGYSPKKLHHIPTFVNSTKWQPRYDNDGYILYFGRLMPEKGIEFLLEAYRQSAGRDPLVIVGDGPDEYVSYLHSLVTDDLKGRVKFVGGKWGEELQQIVGGAKYVVVPSLWHDNAPNVVYESFAAGKPVIASALGGLCEQVTKDVGALVEAGNASELAQAMDRLSGDAALVESMGRNARLRAETEFSIENHVDSLLELFGSLIDAKSGKKRLR